MTPLTATEARVLAIMVDGETRTAHDLSIGFALEEDAAERALCTLHCRNLVTAGGLCISAGYRLTRAGMRVAEGVA